MVPVRPSQFEEILILPGDKLRERFRKTFVCLPPLIYKIIKYMFNADGTMTDQFCADLRAISCPDEEEEEETA